MDKAVIWAVGDAANGSDASIRVGKMILDDNPTKFIYLGDVYDTGAPHEYTTRYERAFGALRGITHPIPGNHDWMQPNKVGYRTYWAGVPDYYSLEINGWKFWFVDSEIPHDVGSPQHTFVTNEVANWPGPCVCSFHRSRWACGGHGDQPDMQPIVDIFKGKRCLLLTGHNHNMQAFKPIDGIVQLVIGSGGQGIVGVGNPDRLSFYYNGWGAVRMEVVPEAINYTFFNLDKTPLHTGSV